MGFDIIDGPDADEYEYDGTTGSYVPVKEKPVARMYAQTKYYGDTPHNPVIEEIYANMTCQDVLNYANYVFYRRTQDVRFGQKSMQLHEVCSQFPTCPARSMAVVAEVGPPNRRGWRLVTLAQLLNDWYWQAKCAKNSFVLDKFQAALGSRGVKCKV